MGAAIDLDAVLAKLPGEKPSGADLRYDPVYAQIKEARRAEDPLAAGGGEPKRADWRQVVDLSVDALATKTKDLQIGAWLTEGLIATEGFEGLIDGLKVLKGLLENFWENLYPSIEEGDLEYRIGPLEFMNEKLWVAVKDIPVTDPQVTDGYSLLKYDESRMVGFEKDTVGARGDVDEGKKAKRDELIAEGRLPAEAFDAAVAKSSRAFYESLFGATTACRQEFVAFEKVVDEKFGKNAPRLAELRKAIEECEQFLKFRIEEKRKNEPSPVDRPPAAKGASPAERESTGKGTVTGSGSQRGISGTVATEADLWQETLSLLDASGIKAALDLLIGECYTAPSARERGRLRLLMARLCLKADRPDLCRPIIEELHAQIQELHLEKWESPLWIAEVLDALYQCLTAREPSDDDLAKARALFQQMCTADVTRAVIYKG